MHYNILNFIYTKVENFQSIAREEEQGILVLGGSFFCAASQPIAVQCNFITLLDNKGTNKFKNA